MNYLRYLDQILFQLWRFRKEKKQNHFPEHQHRRHWGHYFPDGRWWHNNDDDDDDDDDDDGGDDGDAGERERERKREGRLNNTTEKKEKEVMPAPLVGLCQVIM